MLYTLIENKKLLRTLNKIEGRVSYDSIGNLYKVIKGEFTQITVLPILVDTEVVENLTDLQYKLFFKIANKYEDTQGNN